MVLYTLKLVKGVELLSLVITKEPKKQKTNGHEKSFGYDRYIYYLDCNDGIMGVCVCPSTSKCIY